MPGACNQLCAPGHQPYIHYIMYRKISNISCTKYQKLNKSRLILQLSLHSPESNFIVRAQATILYNELKNYTFKFTIISHRSQWANEPCTTWNEQQISQKKLKCAFQDYKPCSNIPQHHHPPTCRDSSHNQVKTANCSHVTSWGNWPSILTRDNLAIFNSLPPSISNFDEYMYVEMCFTNMECLSFWWLSARLQ